MRHKNSTSSRIGLKDKNLSSNQTFTISKQITSYINANLKPIHNKSKSRKPNVNVTKRNNALKTVALYEAIRVNAKTQN